MRKLERLLWAIGAACLGWCGLTLLEARSYQSSHAAAFSRNLTPVTLPPMLAAAPRAKVADRTAIGLIEIRRLGMSAIIGEGDGEATLRLAVGHIPGTAFPGGIGNVGLAGHRDTFFRSLSRIRVDDEIRVTGEGGVAFVYRVNSRAIVDPSDVSVLEAGPNASLTLVTCYPFHYLGPAPKRFVVRAGRVPV
ncbi:MAG TPA: class D sortase [Thermoanaerobaculia bacterium]|nr:class D sortase [Thermoanaerobaculia bacterium]